MKTIKRYVCLALSLFMATTLWAVPAEQFIRKVKQPDGKTLSIQLIGDEFFNYYATTDGVPVKEQADGSYVYARCEKGIFTATATLAHDTAERSAHELTLVEELKAQPIAMSESAAKRRASAQSTPLRKTIQGKESAFNNSDQLKGNFKGIIILVQYPNLKMVHTRAEFDAQMNDNNYNKNGHIGSLSDYFHDQSYGQFNIQFDVVGPYTLSQEMAYYGAKTTDDNDIRPGALVSEAVQMAHADGVDFSKYDWHGNGAVDQVFVIFA
ncbi:MAG: immune inhibitor A, partial [Bacteroidaceae bacterium]|nr:immune inhibitor A [Bacteroidaceae bacterium]